MSDPWISVSAEIINLIQNTEKENNITLEFEDNFSTSLVDGEDRVVPTLTKLPDSESYLESLEKKLSKLKNNQNIVQQLTERREECLRNLLNEAFNLDTNSSIDLDAAIISSESAVHDIYRHIYPVQPISLGETVHIVKHDQLAKSEEDSASETESASR